VNVDLMYLNVLRMLHIVGGTCWVGGAIIFHLFLEPTAKATAPESQRFMQHFIVHRRYSAYMTISSLAVNLSGVLLFWRSSGGLTSSWITSGPGLVFSLGSVLAIVAFSMGMFILAPTAKRLVGLGQALQTADGPPLPEQMSELHSLEKTMNQVGWAEFALMLVSLVTMAVARYWWF
jgi:uncharacterized membrane protein